MKKWLVYCDDVDFCAVVEAESANAARGYVNTIASNLQLAEGGNKLELEIFAPLVKRFADNRGGVYAQLSARLCPSIGQATIITWMEGDGA